METDIGGKERAFPSTAWSAILAAGDLENPSHRLHLEQLIERYWKPVYFYIRAHGRSVEDAKDQTQQFFTRLIEKDSLTQLEPSRGSFRGFLKRSVGNFLIDVSRYEAARQPGADRREFSYIEALDLDVSADENPEVVFDRAWNDELLARALALLEQRLSSKPGYFEVFHCYFFGEEQTQDEVGATLGLSDSQVGRRLAYCRQKLRGILIEEVQAYLADGEELEGELRQILG